MPAMRALHTTDPKQELLAKVGDLSWLELKNNEILCAVYVRPEDAQYGTLKLKLTANTRKEDEFQGKVGLVVKLGPLAYQSDEKAQFADFQKVNVGDWVVFRASDGWQLVITDNQVLCRMFGEFDIRATVTDPDSVW